jgi:hypothetical protein
LLITTAALGQPDNRFYHRFNAEPDHLRHALERAGDLSPDWGQAVRDRQERTEPVFIVVPGILGSKLMKDGQPIWGDMSLRGRHRDELVYSGPVQGEFLDELHLIHHHVDVYGSLLAHVKYREHILPFGYDWRQSIPDIAAQFGAFLRANAVTIDSRPVVFIAHSMGGLVVRWWYAKEYLANPAAYRFIVSAPPPLTLFIGTPHYGSASAVLTLIGGYGKDHGLDGAFANYFMSDINEVGPSFYSVYQLMPFNLFRVSMDGDDASGKDILDPQLWSDCQWAQPVLARVRDKLNPNGTLSADDVEKKFYSEYLGDRLSTAAKFRKEMLAMPSIPGAICFVSAADSRTPASIRITPHRRKSCTVEVSERLAGDGRVVAEFVRGQKVTHDHAAIHEINGGHGELTRSAGFLQFLDDMRQTILVRAILSEPATDNVVAQFRRSGSLLPVPFDVEAARAGAVKSIVEFDRRVLTPSPDSPPSSDNIAEALFRRAEDAQEYSHEASNLYALAVAFAPFSEWAGYAANNLADNLLRDGALREGAAYADHARRLLPQLREKSIADQIYLNLGVGLEKLGQYRAALNAYSQSTMKRASQYRRSLENYLKESGELPDATQTIDRHTQPDRTD